MLSTSRFLPRKRHVGQDLSSLCRDAPSSHVVLFRVCYFASTCALLFS